MEYFVIGVGGFLGANTRYVIGGWLTRHWGTEFPWGTFVINVSGSFLLGLLMAALSTRPLASANYRLFFAVGFLGAYTTFSTFSYESLRLAQDQNFIPALVNIFGSVLLGLLGVIAGLWCGRFL